MEGETSSSMIPVSQQMFNVRHMIGRIVSYIIEGVAVGLAMYVISMKNASIKVSEIITIGLIAAAVFAILDLFSPATGQYARAGAGFGMGFNMVGFNPAMQPVA